MTLKQLFRSREQIINHEWVELLIFQVSFFKFLLLVFFLSTSLNDKWIEWHRLSQVVWQRIMIFASWVTLEHVTNLFFIVHWVTLEVDECDICRVEFDLRDQTRELCKLRHENEISDATKHLTCECLKLKPHHTINAFEDSSISISNPMLIEFIFIFDDFRHSMWIDSVKVRTEEWLDRTLEWVDRHIHPYCHRTHTSAMIATEVDEFIKLSCPRLELFHKSSTDTQPIAITSIGSNSHVCIQGFSKPIDRVELLFSRLLSFSSNFKCHCNMSQSELREFRSLLFVLRLESSCGLLVDLKRNNFETIGTSFDVERESVHSELSLQKVSLWLREKRSPMKVKRNDIRYHNEAIYLQQ